MTEERVKEIIMRDTMEQRKQLSNFMGEVKDLNETILKRLEEQDKRSFERHQEAEARWKLTEEFIKTMMPARDGMVTIQNLIRFFKWIGIAGAAPAIYWVIKKIFS